MVEAFVVGFMSYFDLQVSVLYYSYIFQDKLQSHKI